MDGLFGAIAIVPEPSTWAVLLLGFGGLSFAAKRRFCPRLSIG